MNWNVEKTDLSSIHVHCAKRFGVSNRLRSMVGHCALATLFKVPFSFSWLPDPSCPDDLSEFLFSRRLQERSFEAASADSACLLVHPGSTPTHCGSTVEAIAKAYVPLGAEQEFALEVSRFLMDLEPRPRIRQRAESILDPLRGGHSGKVLGLHVRRTDLISHLTAQGGDLPSDEALFSKVDAFLRNNPEATIFCSADNPESENKVLLRYPGKVALHRKRWIIDNVNDALNVKVQARLSTLEESIVDLYCLSRCDSIVGTRGSSFSVFAAKWGDRPYVLA